jgi:hypothetical protein
MTPLAEVAGSFKNSPTSLTIELRRVSIFVTQIVWRLAGEGE